MSEDRPPRAAGEPRASAERQDATILDPFGARRARSYKIEQALWLVFGIVEALLVIRLILRLLGANEGSSFVSGIYGVTAPFVGPFVGIFGVPRAEGGNVLEPHTVIAIVVYALVAWGLVKIAWLLFGETRSGTTTTTERVKTDDQERRL